MVLTHIYNAMTTNKNCLCLILTQCNRAIFITSILPSRRLQVLTSIDKPILSKRHENILWSCPNRSKIWCSITGISRSFLLLISAGMCYWQPIIHESHTEGGQRRWNIYSAEHIVICLDTTGLQRMSQKIVVNFFKNILRQQCHTEQKHTKQWNFFK